MFINVSTFHDQEVSVNVSTFHGYDSISDIVLQFKLLPRGSFSS